MTRVDPKVGDIGGTKRGVQQMHVSGSGEVVTIMPKILSCMHPSLRVLLPIDPRELRLVRD